MSVAITMELDARARQSRGASHDAIYAMVAASLHRHGAIGGRLVDVGCGSGGLRRFLAASEHGAAIGPALLASYCGCDAVRYDSWPEEAEFHQVDLDAAPWPIVTGDADAVVAVETIEHLENPWAFMRQLAALARPGGLVVVTTPNQLSLLSLLTLVMKQRFSAFQDSHYPAHRTALLESDLRRAAAAAGLDVLETVFTGSGRLPLSAWHYPSAVAALAPRWLSDNMAVIARRPRG